MEYAEPGGVCGSKRDKNDKKPSNYSGEGSETFQVNREYMHIWSKFVH